MFGKQALIAVTGQVINVTGLTANELFTLDLASEVQKQPIWELLFRALFIYLFMEIAAARAGKRASKSCPPTGAASPRRKQNTRKTKRQIDAAEFDLDEAAALLCVSSLFTPVGNVGGAPSPGSQRRLEEKALIAERSRDGGGSVPRITGPRRPPRRLARAIYPLPAETPRSPSSTPTL